jgi:hypothetical protein
MNHLRVRGTGTLILAATLVLGLTGPPTAAVGTRGVARGAPADVVEQVLVPVPGTDW